MYIFLIEEVLVSKTSFRNVKSFTNYYGFAQDKGILNKKPSIDKDELDTTQLYHEST